MQKINFLRGVPADEALQPLADVFAGLYTKVFHEYGARVLQYHIPGLADFCGFVPLKETLAGRFKARGDANKRVICTNGGMETVSFVFKSFPQGSIIATDALTYDRVLIDIHKHNHVVIGVPLSDEGTDLDELERVLAENKVMVFYQVGYHQSPTGITTTNANLEAASEICARYGTLHLIDIAYFELRYDGKQNKMIDLDKFPETTCIAGSFTKTISPGAKCGFGIFPESVVEKLTPVLSNTRLNPNYPTQAAIHLYIDSGHYDKHLEFLIDLYKPRMEAMNQAIKNYLPETKVAKLTGGFFVGLPLRGISDENAFILAAEGKGVVLAAPTVFAPEWKERYYQENECVYFRLTFPAHTPEENEKGIAIIAEVYNEVLNVRRQT